MTQWRTAHGKAAKLGRLTVLESTPADELSPACPSETARPDREASGRFAPGNKLARMAKVRAGKRGALAALEATGDEARRAAVKWGRRYSSHRRAELAKFHGGEISAGVGTLVETAGDLLADARYFRARSVKDGDPEFARLAAQLSTAARQAERDAWELASREAAARPKKADAAPWLVDATENASGAENAKTEGEPTQNASGGQQRAATGHPKGPRQGTGKNSKVLADGPEEGGS